MSPYQQMTSPSVVPPRPYTTRTTCRVCGGSGLTPLFSLGDQYVSDFVPVDRVHGGPRCPIDIERCDVCTLVQARHTAPQDFLYTRHYWYRSGTTDTMKAALKDVARMSMERVELNEGDVVLDIGSNDGTLLRNYPANVVRVGVEPAKNMWDCYDSSMYCLKEMWGDVGVAEDYLQCHGSAKIVTALGMFYDLEDPNVFVRDVAKALHPDGLFVAQLMCLKQTLEKGDVGNFAHEHLEFYTLRSLDYLFNRHGLKVVDLEENAVNGGSYRLYVRHEAHPDVPTPAVIFVRRSEGGNTSAVPSFLKKIERTRNQVRMFLWQAREEGKRVWVYGASTKGNVMLQYWGVDGRMIEAAVDKSPEKWGKYTVGSGIPIRSEDDFRRERPDYALVLPYAFVYEFVERESEWRAKGGKFIVPQPEFVIV